VSPNFRASAGKRLQLLAALLLLATLCAALSAHFWFFELFSHFRPYYAVFGVLCVIGLGATRAWRWAAVAMLLALWNGYPIVRLLLQEFVPPTSVSRHVTVFHFNVGLHHEEPQRVGAFLRRRAKLVDVVVLLETSDRFAPVLDELKDVFPHQVRHLEDSPFGIALVSRFPLQGTVSREPSGAFPHIEAAAVMPERAEPLMIYAVHAPPPIAGDMAAARNLKFDYVARKAAAQPNATPIVVGDFNLTPWSPYFQKFIADSGLRDARMPRRFDNTWPVTFNNANLGIAIDHSFAHASLPLVKRDIGPDLGSDNLPVTVTFGY
jgi:vancomycin resistance protein VanJ